MAATPSYGYQAQARRNTTRAPVYVDPTRRTPQQSDSLFQTPLISPTPKAPPVNPVAPGPRAAAPVKAPATSAAVAPHPQASVAAPQAPLQVYDYTTDPILQQIQGLSTQDRSGADAGALAVKRQLAQQYGDPTIAGIGDSYAATAGANPHGAFQRLKSTYDQNSKNLDESLNNQNLWYSGARILQQRGLADEYGHAVADTTAGEQQALGQTEQSRLAAYLAADKADQQAQQDAAMRALQMALASPSTGGGIGGIGGDNGSYDNPGGTPDAPLPHTPAPAPGAHPYSAQPASSYFTANRNWEAPQAAPFDFSHNLNWTDLVQALGGYGSAAQRRKQAA